MADRPLLTRFPRVTTKRPDEFQALAPMYSIVDIEIPNLESFDSQVNVFELGGVRLTYAWYGSPIKLKIAGSDWFFQGFPLTGTGEVTFGSHSVAVSRDRGGAGAGPGTVAMLRYAAGFSHLFVTMRPEALTQKLSVLLGQPVDPPLAIDSRAPRDPSILQTMARLVRFVAEEADDAQGALPPALMQEMEQSILVGYLVASRSNYSHLLHGDSTPVAPRHVSRTIDFLEEHWQDPVTIDMLASVAGTGARNLFYTFRLTHGISPMRYVRRLRLQHARDMLSTVGANHTVTSAAYTCGFSNLGYFAREYYRAFGEKPSTTLATRPGNGHDP